MKNANFFSTFGTFNKKINLFENRVLNFTAIGKFDILVHFDSTYNIN